jgi:hypothetical protein
MNLNKTKFFKDAKILLLIFFQTQSVSVPFYEVLKAPHITISLWEVFAGENFDYHHLAFGSTACCFLQFPARVNRMMVVLISGCSRQCITLT